MTTCPECGFVDKRTTCRCLIKRERFQPSRGTMTMCYRCGVMLEYVSGTETVAMPMSRWNRLSLEIRSELGMAAILARRRRHGEQIA